MWSKDGKNTRLKITTGNNHGKYFEKSQRGIRYGRKRIVVKIQISVLTNSSSWDIHVEVESVKGS